MNEALAQTLAALTLAVRLSLPFLGASFLITLAIALVAAWTRLGEPALATLPRALVTLLVLSGTASFMAHELVGYATGLFRALPQLAL